MSLSVPEWHLGYSREERRGEEKEERKEQDVKINCERTAIIFNDIMSTWIALIDPEVFIVGEFVGGKSI